MTAAASKRANVMNENTVELEQTEEMVTDEVSDEALEAAASGMMEQITFTFSIHPIYCRFC
jgi:ssDNA-binding replication factor A large subunit